MDDELQATSGDPAAGEVWWCRGETLGLPDGGKVRPVLVIAISGTHAEVVALTTRKPAKNPIGVAHQGGLSWLTDARRFVPAHALLSNLGAWTGFDRWFTAQ